MYCSLLRIQFTSSTQIKPSQMAFGRTVNILYLLTYLLVQVLPQWKDFSVHLHSAQVLTAIRCRIQDNTLDMHIFLRSILKHWSMTLTFLIIEELVGPLVAVDSRNVTDCLCWVVHCEAYFLNQRLAQALFNSNFLTVFYLLFNNNTLICFGGSCKAAWVSASVMMFELQKLCVWKKLEISWN